MINWPFHHASRTIVWIAGTLLLIAPRPSAAQTDVTTQHNDNARTGLNASETVLTAFNVNGTQFGKLFERIVDDQVYAQPLLVSGLDIPGVGLRNVLYVATVNDTVYAFDADDPAATAPIWKVSYINPAAGIVPVNHNDFTQPCDGGPYVDFTGNIGIVGTPAIDRATETMYFVVRTNENGTFVQRLHAVDILSGQERPGSPILIQATVVGTGDGHDAQNNIAFNPKTQNQRAALLLNNGVVYIAWASHCDQGPYHGWILGYNAATLQQTMLYNDTPNGGLAGIWQSGQGLSVDAAGNVYALTGNGTFDGDTGGSDRGNSFLKVSPAGQLLDWFTPYNWATLSSTDRDLGIQGALLMPGTNLVVAGGKQGVMYVLDRNNMGHFQAGSDSQIVQSFQVSTSGRMNGSPVYWNSLNGPQIYVWPAGDPLKVFRLVNGRFQTTPVAQGPVLSPGGMPGGILSLTANGNNPGTGIVWAAMSNAGSPNHATQPGILRAYDASDITKELWNSQMNATRDGLGNFAKFVPPTVANGKVYMATFSQKVVVYGLSPGNSPPVVDAGPDQTITLPNTATLSGNATDDGNPVPPGSLTTQWSLMSGPAPVTFSARGSLRSVVTFTTAGVYTLQLTATDGAIATSDNVVITVSSESTPFSGTPVALPGTIQAENFDNGGAEVAYHDSSSGNSGGLYRTTDVDVEATTDSGGGYNVGWTVAGEWLKYTVSVATAGSYTLDVRVASKTAGGTFHIEANGVNVTGPMAVPTTGAWQTWTTVSRPDVPLAAGTQVLRLVIDTVGSGATFAGNFNWIRATKSPTASTPFSGTPVVLPGTIQTEDFDNGRAEVMLSLVALPFE